MKTYLTILAGLLALASGSTSAQECQYREGEGGRKIYVVPMYKAEVIYNFFFQDKSAFAQLSWSLDEEKTKKCFDRKNVGLPSNTSLSIPTVRMDRLSVRLLGASTETELKAFEQANGHWFGHAVFDIDYRMKNEILKTIRAKKSVVSINGDLRFRMKKEEPVEVGRIACSVRGRDMNVYNLNRRMQDIKKVVESKNANMEDVNKKFFKNCLLFKEVSASSLVDFDKEFGAEGRLTSGEISLERFEIQYSTEQMPTVTHETVSDFEL